MKSSIKNAFAILLALVLILGIAACGTTQNGTDSDKRATTESTPPNNTVEQEATERVSQPSFTEQVTNLTRDVLLFMETEKELYGLSNIDFTTLSLGKQIPAYILTASGLTTETSIYYFPLISNGVWVATSIVTYDSSQHMNVQISIDYANAYAQVKTNSQANTNSQAKTNNDELALIFDESHAFFYLDGKLAEAAISPDIIPGRIAADDYQYRLNPETKRIESEYSIDIGKYSLPGDSRFSSQKYLMVPCIKQPAGSSQCWAASIASIRGYYGTATTIDNVYTFSGVPKYNDADTYKAASVLGSYGYNVTWYWNGSFNWYQLRTEIDAYANPFYVFCQYNTASGHAVVLRAYYEYQNISQLGIIGYMDPITGTYEASTVATDKNFYYVPSGSSVQYAMQVFLAVF